MAYNHRRAEILWNRKKRREEKLLKKYGFSQEKIQELYNYDRKLFNLERRYQEKEQVTKEEFFNSYPVYDSYHIESHIDLLQYIENKQLYLLLKQSNEVLLKILYLRYLGYTINEIAEDMNLTPNAVRKRINKFKKKLRI